MLFRSKPMRFFTGSMTRTLTSSFIGAAGVPPAVFSCMDFSFPLRVSMARSLLMAAEDGFCKAARFEQGKTQQHRISHASPDRPDGVAVGGDTLDQHRIDGDTD